MSKMFIEIEPDNIMITKVENGVSTRKASSLADLQAILTRDRSLETPLLPGFWGTQKFIASGDRELFVFTTPPHVRLVSYDYRSEAVGERVKKFKIPVPGTLWIVTTRVSRSGTTEQRVLIHTMAYALKQPLLGERDILYRYPFSNVGSNYVCWGGNDPKLGGSKSIQSVPEMFYNNNFNSDLDGKFAEFHWEKNGQRIKAFRTMHFFEYLAKEQENAEKTGTNAEFRYDALQQQGWTVADAIHHHKESMNR